MPQFLTGQSIDGHTVSRDFSRGAKEAFCSPENGFAACPPELSSMIKYLVALSQQLNSKVLPPLCLKISICHF